MSKKHIIYIIGFMGSGKSTAGKKLAASMGWNFIDLDRKIEEIEGIAIPDIFSRDGEEHFRMIEARVLKSMGSLTDTVISTGGGAPCHGDNMDFMLKTGLTIYLKLTPGQLATRLLESSGERPLIKNVPDDELRGFIEKKLAQREKWYNMAGVIVEGINLDMSLLRSLIHSNREI
jgi:shikimate kinase